MGKKLLESIKKYMGSKSDSCHGAPLNYRNNTYSNYGDGATDPAS